jgi:uncharacterized SAM-dependent methyltransferase
VVLPVCADFSEELELPLTVDSKDVKKVIFFPGSTIGNLHPGEAVSFLKHYGKMIKMNYVDMGEIKFFTPLIKWCKE